MNEEQKRTIVETQTWLFQSVPACFRSDHSCPLKVGILKDVFDRLPADKSISRLQIRRALKFYTNHPAYQKTLIKKKERFDLEGNIVGEVKEEHKETAKKILSFRRIKAFAHKSKEG